jgi:hypothetical protein
MKRAMITLVYAVAFLCLLSIDEALKLEVRLIDKETGEPEIMLDISVGSAALSLQIGAQNAGQLG